MVKRLHDSSEAVSPRTGLCSLTIYYDKGYSKFSLALAGLPVPTTVYPNV